jgi:hypothetical protein
MIDDIWTWLRGCEACGKPHEPHPVQPCDGPPDHRTATGPERLSWADPTDGHNYRPRLAPGTVSRLQAAYELVRAKAP